MHKIKKYHYGTWGTALNFADNVSSDFLKGLKKTPPAVTGGGVSNTGLSNLFSKLNLGMTNPKP
ncbi:MAG: hypothetical protein ACOH2V_00020 [Candidatus Saccharimonadaceae bacterium]